MRVALVSKALIVGAYQRKAEEIARLGVELTVLAPPLWRDRRGVQRLERAHTVGYDLRVIPIRLAGNFHLHFYPTLGRELARIRPDVLHMDEEPYNLATWLALRAGASLGVRNTFFTWQNLHRRYPPPFRQMEQANYRAAPIAIAGNQDAAAVLRRKGFGGEIQVIPQFGVDPLLFAPGDSSEKRASPAGLRVGYVGGLLHEKGVDLLVNACAGLSGDWRLTLTGAGEMEAQLRELCQTRGVVARVTFTGRVNSDSMPLVYRDLDALVLPSRTLPTWKEQFGRVLIEAMACGVAVVGSDSGEIPHVVGDAGLIFPEGDADALRAALQRLADCPDERRRLAEAGRRRVLDRFGMGQIARETVAVYQRLLNREPAA